MRLFLMVQKSVGRGLPLARHSNEVSVPSSMDLLIGRCMNLGGAVCAGVRFGYKVSIVQNWYLRVFGIVSTFELA